MTVIVKGLTLLALFAYGPAFSQEHQHDQHQGQKETASAQPVTTKCYEGMDKMEEMNADMPMKGEMKSDMKATMAEKMKEKGMDRVNSKGSEPTVEKNHSIKDVRQR